MKLIANDLGVMRGEDLILTGIDFEVSSRQALIVKGPNGAGKSTLLRAIAELLPLVRGTLTFDDPDGEFSGAKLSDLCHYLGHHNAMKQAMSVTDNLLFWQEFCGQPHLPVDDALEMIGLDGLQSVPFAHLSTGQRRRIGIARLLVSYRPIWLLDEPTAGLDAASDKQFSALMQAHLDDAGLIIAATHVPLGLSSASVLDLSLNVGHAKEAGS